MANPSGITSQWYPYFKVQEGYSDFSQTVDIPRIICDYLMDAPNGEYEPPNDNRYSRCRFWKYLFHDGQKPLEEQLPTIRQKKSVLFNPDKPEEPPTKKGYRLIPQIFVKQEQEIAQTRVNCYIGRTIPSNDDIKVCVSVVFDIWSNYTYESNTKADEYSRTLGIEQALIEAFHGVNMTGIGTFFFSRAKHPDCGSRVISDGKSNVGRELILALELASTETQNLGEMPNKPQLEDGLAIW